MEPKKPPGFEKFDSLMQKLAKVPLEAVLTDAQKELKRKHGTPEQFAAACNAAVGDLMVTPAEAQAAIETYCREWAEAGRQSPKK